MSTRLSSPRSASTSACSTGSTAARVIADIADLAAKNDKQVLLTTHNPALLDGLDLSDDAQRLLVCERDLDGHTRLRRVSAPSDRTVNLSEAFMRGYLGGLPRSF